MELYNNYENFSFSTKLAIGSFLIGTVLFILNIIFPNEEGILILGFSFVLFAVFFNSIVLIILFLQIFTIPDERENTCIKILILLSNIPIAILYFLLVANVIKTPF